MALEINLSDAAGDAELSSANPSPDTMWGEK
jgi:hypothetical protein